MFFGAGLRLWNTDGSIRSATDKEKVVAFPTDVPAEDMPVSGLSEQPAPVEHQSLREGNTGRIDNDIRVAGLVDSRDSDAGGKVMVTVMRALVTIT